MYFSLLSYDQPCIQNAHFRSGYYRFALPPSPNIRMTIIILKSFIKWGFINISFFTFASQIRRIKLPPAIKALLVAAFYLKLKLILKQFLINYA